jgi:hypothetical protein
VPKNEEIEMVLVPRVPTQAMIDAAWAPARGEEAAEVWREMIDGWLSRSAVETRAGAGAQRS